MAQLSLLCTGALTTGQSSSTPSANLTSISDGSLASAAPSMSAPLSMPSSVSTSIFWPAYHLFLKSAAAEAAAEAGAEAKIEAGRCLWSAATHSTDSAGRIDGADGAGRQLWVCISSPSQSSMTPSENRTRNSVASPLSLAPKITATYVRHTLSYERSSYEHSRREPLLLLLVLVRIRRCEALHGRAIQERHRECDMSPLWLRLLRTSVPSCVSTLTQSPLVKPYTPACLSDR